MATVTQPNITISLSVNTGCSGISLTDITGNYAVTNTGGYGLPSGPAINDVTTVTIDVMYNTLGGSLTYAFTVLNGVIQTATLAIAGGTPTSILGSLPSTAWPFVTPFDLTGDYGITIPTFEDDIFSVTYTVAGTVGITAFSFQTISNLSVSCQTQCCLDKKWIDVDLDKDCSCDAFYGQALLNQATYSAQYADLAKAVDSLNKAKALCDCGCQ